MKLSNLKKNLLRNTFLNKKYNALIFKFKKRVFQILFRLQKNDIQCLMSRKQRNS